MAFEFFNSIENVKRENQMNIGVIVVVVVVVRATMVSSK